MENVALVTVRFPIQSPPRGRNVVSPPNSSSTKSVASSSTSKKVTTAGMSEMLDSTPAVPTTYARSDAPPPNDATLGIKIISAGLAGCMADMVTFPLDTAKVRLQIQGEGVAAVTASSLHNSSSAVAHARGFTSMAAQSVVAAAQPKYRGLFGTIATMSREEGFRALYNGLCPGLQRQMCFASVRIGFYDTVKHSYSKLLKANPEDKNIMVRILAGITTGGAAVLVAQPTDVVKVRMQAQRSGAKRYSGAMSAYHKIAVEEGVRGLWRGTLPNISRNAVVNCTELVSYDLIKEAFLSRHLLSDNIPCHFLSAIGAGFFTTLLASPIDVVKTRFMNSSDGVYRGALDCAMKMHKEGGMSTFYKGAVPAFLRFGPWNVVMFVSYEQLKKVFSNSDDLGSNMNKLKELGSYVQLNSGSSRVM